MRMKRMVAVVCGAVVMLWMLSMPMLGGSTTAIAGTLELSDRPLCGETPADPDGAASSDQRRRTVYWSVDTRRPVPPWLDKGALLTTAVVPGPDVLACGEVEVAAVERRGGINAPCARVEVVDGRGILTWPGHEEAPPFVLREIELILQRSNRANGHGAGVNARGAHDQHAATHDLIKGGIIIPGDIPCGEDEAQPDGSRGTYDFYGLLGDYPLMGPLVSCESPPAKKKVRPADAAGGGGDGGGYPCRM